MALDSNAQTTIYIYMLCVSFRTHREDVDDDESRVRRAHMDYITVWSVVLPFLFCFFPSWFSVSFLLTHYSFPAHVFSHQVSISSKCAFIWKLKSSRASIDGILPFHTYGACKKQKCYQQQWTANERQKRSAIFHFVHRMTRHDTVTHKNRSDESERRAVRCEQINKVKPKKTQYVLNFGGNDEIFLCFVVHVHIWNCRSFPTRLE